MDNRYNRDAYDTVDGDFLGPVQWAWLENELIGSKAAFNVIVSGIQVLPDDRFSLAEGWSRFPNQRERLLQLILASKAKGVILLRYDNKVLLCVVGYEPNLRVYSVCIVATCTFPRSTRSCARMARTSSRRSRVRA